MNIQSQQSTTLNSNALQLQQQLNDQLVHNGTQISLQNTTAPLQQQQQPIQNNPSGNNIQGITSINELQKLLSQQLIHQQQQQQAQYLQLQSQLQQPSQQVASTTSANNKETNRFRIIKTDAQQQLVQNPNSATLSPPPPSMSQSQNVQSLNPMNNLNEVVYANSNYSNTVVNQSNSIQQQQQPSQIQSQTQFLIGNNSNMVNLNENLNQQNGLINNNNDNQYYQYQQSVSSAPVVPIAQFVQNSNPVQQQQQQRAQSISLINNYQRGRWFVADFTIDQQQQQNIESSPAQSKLFYLFFI
jgi:hypothetical protein